MLRSTKKAVREIVAQEMANLDTSDINLTEGNEFHSQYQLNGSYNRKIGALEAARATLEANNLALETKLEMLEKFLEIEYANEVSVTTNLGYRKISKKAAKKTK